MNSNPGVSIHAYNGMKGRLVRALKEIDRINFLHSKKNIINYLISIIILNK